MQAAIIIEYYPNRGFRINSTEFDWGEEHGLQLIFKNGERLTRASGHDGHYED
ncbi:MAG: hypothetical protein ABJ004_16815 [Cyclobacteriaceae bacterium]